MPTPDLPGPGPGVSKQVLAGKELGRKERAAGGCSGFPENQGRLTDHAQCSEPGAAQGSPQPSLLRAMSPS